MTETRHSGLNLVHFSNDVVQAVESVRQTSEVRHGKPRGLWVSIEGNGDGWSDWCAAEDYGIGSIAHRVTLKPEAKILILSGASELSRFHSLYRCVDDYIAWDHLAGSYQGIIIAPYCWEHRLSGPVSRWYYGWDCASGCIWDAAAIESIIPIHEEAIA